jgi:hypothetical protein
LTIETPNSSRWKKEKQISKKSWISFKKMAGEPARLPPGSAERRRKEIQPKKQSILCAVGTAREGIRQLKLLCKTNFWAS